MTLKVSTTISTFPHLSNRTFYNLGGLFLSLSSLQRCESEWFLAIDTPLDPFIKGCDVILWLKQWILWTNTPLFRFLLFAESRTWRDDLQKHHLSSLNSRFEREHCFSDLSLRTPHLLFCWHGPCCKTPCKRSKSLAGHLSKAKVTQGLTYYPFSSK